MLKERLEEALMNKSETASYIWKGKKVKVGDKFVQDEFKLIDASDDKLREIYKHCNTMLFNESKDDLGRYLVLNLIKDQKDRCNTELFLRSLENSDVKIPRYVLNEQIQEILKTSNNSAKELTIQNVSQNCPLEFKNLPLTLVIDGCLDKLGVFNKKHLTLAFILKQGVWLTPQEMKDLTEIDNSGNIRNRLDVIRERLNIDKNILFRINSKGLSYTNLRALLQLKNKKYSELTTDQLTVLRNRILFNLENEIKYHARQWESRMKQIEEVANERGIKL